MDAPAPDNIAAEEGGQQQMHQDEKEHKPMLRRVKDKMKKIKNTISGHGHDHDHEQDTGDSNSADEDEEDAAMREAEVEKGGYQQQDVEDKPIFADSSPELLGAPMYDSERIPAAAKEVKHNDAPGVRLGDLGGPASAQEVKRDDAAGMRLGDFGGPASAKEVKRDDAPEGLKNAATGATGTEGLKNAATGATGTEGLKNAATDATTDGAPGATYTDMIKSAAAGTMEYGKKLASTVYEKVAGIGTAVASKAQQVTTSAGTASPGVGAQDGATTWATATPGVGAQDGATTRATVTPGAGGPGNGQDKGVTGVTAYIAEKLRPGDEERSLSEAFTGAVQQCKDWVGSTVAKAREVLAQAVTRARGAVTSLTGGNRVSETVQPTTEGNVGEGVAAEGPVLHGAAPRTNTNVM